MNLREYLRQGEPLLFDGAMGTLYAALPGRSAERCEQACLDHPEEIRSIHEAYLQAGCRAIKTNTFSLIPEEPELLAAACRLAKEAAAGYDAWVFADMGPAPRESDAGEHYCRLADQFVAQGLDCFLVETLPGDDGIETLADYLKLHCPGSYLIVSYAVGFDGVTRDGYLGADLLRRTAALEDVDAVGFNCVSGPHHMLEYIRTLDLGGLTLSVMPNAGYPTVLGRRTAFQSTPEYFGQKLSDIAKTGAMIVGGCCGTTPEHIACAAKALKEIGGSAVSPKPEAVLRERNPKTNTLAEKLDAGRRVIAVELDPPADDNVDFFLKGVRTLRDAGADVVTIADCPVGRPRADSSLLACKVKRELGIEPLPHMTCRDRNLNATKALLLGLSIEGVHNVLIVTGDPIPTEDRDAVKSVFNFNSRKLARYISNLNETTMQTPFRVFGALNLNARNFEMQLKIAVEKEACGVSGFLTQPVLSPEALENLKLARATLKGTILGGIFPVVSHKNACFLNNEISGMRVCDDIVRLYEGLDREAAEDLAVRISEKVAEAILPYTDGFYLMTPFKRVELMHRILEKIRALQADDSAI